MRTTNCRKGIICQRFAEIQLSEHDRQLATQALRDGEAIAHAVIWVKKRFAAFGGVLLKPALKH